MSNLIPLLKLTLSFPTCIIVLVLLLLIPNILLNYFIEAYYRTADEVVNIKKEPLAVDLEIHGMSGIDFLFRRLQYADYELIYVTASVVLFTQIEEQL